MYQGYSGYGGYNPQAQAQQRLMQIEQMQQMQNQYQPQMQMQTQQTQNATNNIKPVTSLEEVRGVTPNFDGTKMYFEDITNNKMYVKFIDLNGLPVTRVFGLEETPAVSESTKSEFVSKKEFDDLKVKIDKYEGIINQFIGQGGQDNE